MVLGLPWEGRSPVLTIVGIIIFGVIPALLVLEVLRCVYLEYRGDRMPILLYHRLVCKADADRGLVRDDEMVWASYDTRFAEQMEYLKQAGWTTLDFDDFLKIRAGEMPRPAKPVFITFDDGYVSNYTMGLPVFKRLRLKATIYVSPEPNEYTRKQVEGVDGFMTPQQLREMTEAGAAPEAIHAVRVERLGVLCDHVRDAGLSICLENVPNCPEVDDLLAIITAVGRDNLGICLDTGHLNMASGDQVGFIRGAGAYLRATHLADNEGLKDQHLMPYERGTVDWPAVMGALGAIGYRGLANLETPGESHGMPLAIKRAKLDYLHRVMDYLLELAARG